VGSASLLQHTESTRLHLGPAILAVLAGQEQPILGSRCWKTQGYVMQCARSLFLRCNAAVC